MHIIVISLLIYSSGNPKGKVPQINCSLSCPKYYLILCKVKSKYMEENTYFSLVVYVRFHKHGGNINHCILSGNSLPWRCLNNCQLC
jgi:hypothetical protein